MAATISVLILLGGIQAPMLDHQSERDVLGKCVGATSLDAATMDCYRRASVNAELRLDRAYGQLRRVLAPADFEKLQSAQRRWREFRESDRTARKAIMGDQPGTLDRVTDIGDEYALVSARADDLEGWVARLVR